MIIFVDTNVLLDVIGRRGAFHAPAALVWGLAEAGKVRGFVSAVSFNNVFYIVRRFAGAKRALEAVRLVHAVFETAPVNGGIIAAAMESGIADFEDAIQYHCALESGARYLVTRNRKDFPARGPSLVAPEEFLGLMRA